MKRVEREKAVLQDKLYAAQKLVKQVMAEGGALLDTYHLEYSDIDFGGEDVEERCKLGEGAQVLTYSLSTITSPRTDLFVISCKQVRDRVQGHPQG
jgi:hypothetical protein